MTFNCGFKRWKYGFKLEPFEIDGLICKSVHKNAYPVDHTVQTYDRKAY